MRLDSTAQAQIVLEHHGVSGSALDFLVLLWSITQFFDDVHDGDPVQDFNFVLYSTLLSLPANSFYAEHRPALAPAIHVAIEKWHMANEREKAKEGDARSFMWRAAYWDVAAVVCSLTGNPNIRYIVSAYNESFDEYLKEVNHA